MKKINLAGCVILKDDAILLLHRIKNDWFELPGGKIDDKETPEQAAIRELKEELNCDIEIVRKIGDKDFKEHGYVMGYTWFLAKIKDGQEPSLGEPDKFDRFAYVQLDQLQNYKLSLNMQNLVKELDKKLIT